MMRAAVILALVAIVSCESREEANDEASPESTSDAAVQRSDVATEVDAAPDLAAEAKPLVLDPPLEARPRSYDELKKELDSAEPVGTIRGKIFNDSKLLAVVREECGEGAILQPVFRQDSKIKIGTPVRLPLFSLATDEAVSFEDRIFRVNSHFTHDSDERLAGELTISYPVDGEQQTFIHIDVDSKPLKGLMKPRLDGDGPLPSYPRCTPTGYVRVEADEQAWSFFAHADNIDDKGVPWVWIALRPSTLLQIMVIAPKPNTEIEGLEQPLDVQAARSKSSRPAVVLGKFLHTGRIAPDAEATSENLIPPEEASMLDGKITELSLVKESGSWRLRMTLEDIMISEMLGSDLAGRTIDEIRIDTYLAPPGDLEPRLADEPEWWRSSHE